MTTDETLACEALILSLLRGYPSLASSIGRGTIDSYLRAVEPYALGSVRQACDRFADGAVPGFDRRFPPNAAELAAQCRVFEPAATAETEKLVSYPMGGEPPPGYVPLGPLSVDHGHGRIDMRGMDHPTKEFVLTHKRLPEPGELGEKPQIGFTPRFQRA